MSDDEEISELLKRHRVRRSEALRAIMRSFMQHPTEEFYGMQLLDVTGLRPGSVYPLLHKLAESGALLVREVPPNRSAGQAPERVYYRLSELGYRVGSSLLAPTEILSRAPVLAPLG